MNAVSTGTTEAREITAIEVQAKNSRRRNIYLDGEFAFGIHQDVLLDCGIARGDRLSEEDISRILKSEGIKRAKEKALRLLSVRARSEAEMRRRLLEADIDTSAVEKVLLDLREIGLLNDREFALSFARNSIVTRPCGPSLLRRELKNKGIVDELIALALEEAYRETPVEEIARQLAAKKRRQLGSVEEVKAKKRMVDFLARRGFSWEIINDMLDHWQSLE